MQLLGVFYNPSLLLCNELLLAGYAALELGNLLSKVPHVLGLGVDVDDTLGQMKKYECG